MRIMLDTNVLISAIVLNSTLLNCMLEKIMGEHTLVLSSYVLSEFKEVVNRKFDNKARYVDVFLTALPFELVYTPNVVPDNLFDIRDEKDYLVLYTAIIDDVDVLITGDKDFAEIEVERPEILSSREFMDKYFPG